MDSITATNSHELVLQRTLLAPRMTVWRCWTEPALMEQWFCPKPWYVSDVKSDLRAGGAISMMMRGPDGQAFPNNGAYLEIIHGQRLVTTDAFNADWQPSGKAFMVVDITMADAPGGGTLYKAVARHWNAQDRQSHMEMGFHTGWGIAADQLDALAKTL
jgi:uncharacterized protein YndB with AHSA1/START domain